VVTVRSQKVNWFTLDIDALLQQGSSSGAYLPEFHLTDHPISKDILEHGADDESGQVKAFLKSRLEAPATEGAGTLILMSRLTTQELPSDIDIQRGLANRFTVVLVRDDFKVTVNGGLIVSSLAMPAFELRIPPAAQPFAIEKVGEKEVKYWAGFVGAAEWSADEAGVGVFVHGKVGQDRPFFFGVKGKEIYQRYLYSVVEADWLDELPRDLVSTDRTSINWEDPEAVRLHEWGKKKVAEWLNAFTEFRQAKHNNEVKVAAEEKRTSRVIPTFSESENQSIDELVSNATRELGKGKMAEKARDELLSAVSQAWVNLPARRLLKEIWEALSASTESGVQFADLANRLHQHSVPESMNHRLKAVALVTG
jgi:hypothetical protein